MLPLLLALSLSSPANISVHASAGSCVNADDVAQALPPMPRDAEARIVVDGRGADLVLRVAPDRSLARRIDAPCAALPAVTARVIARFLAALPQEAWPTTATTATQATTPAKTAPPPPVLTSTPPPRPARPGPSMLALSLALEAEVGRSVVRESLIPEIALVFPALINVEVYGDTRVSAEELLFHRLGTRSLAATSLLFGSGLAFGLLPDSVLQVGARAGIVDVITGDGRARVAPAMELVADERLAVGPVFFRFDGTVPLLPVVIHAPGVAPVAMSPFYVGVGVGLLTDLPLSGNTRP
ncbi:MAG TPA: hypothetical protein VGO62_01055 [Myxococcota bacterium]|jgi:hypothetical protein